MNRPLTSLLLALAVLVIPAGPISIATHAALHHCSGCGGGAAVDWQDGASCGSVGITVLVTSGVCRSVYSVPDGAHSCAETPCQATVTRSWSGFPSGCGFLFCNRKHEGMSWMCLQDAPDSGPGHGSHTMNHPLLCGQGRTWKIASTSCCDGVSAQVSSSCGACP